MLWITLLAHFLAVGCSLLLTRRGSRKLRLLSMVVGLMSVTQTVGFLHRSGYFQSGSDAVLAGIHEGMVAFLCICAMLLLGSEMFERQFLELKCRLFEHEVMPTPSREQRHERQEMPTPSAQTAASA